MAEAATAEACVSRAAEGDIDVVLMDLRFEDAPPEDLAAAVRTAAAAV